MQTVRKLERIDNTFGSDLMCSVQCGTEIIECDVADYNALGFRITCRDEKQFEMMLNSEIESARILFGKYVLGHLTHPKVLRAQEGTLGIVLVSTSRSTMTVVTRPRRLDVPYLLEPIVVGADPVRFKEKIVLRIVNISERGFRAKCSLSNKHLLTKHKFKDFEICIPTIGNFKCSFSITNIRAESKFITVGCEFLDATPTLNRAIGHFILLCTCLDANAGVESVEPEVFPKKLSPVLRFRRIDRRAEMDEVQKLRLLAYLKANKVVDGSTPESMTDEYDENSIITGAFIGSRLVGTFRIVFCTKGNPLPFEKYFPFPADGKYTRENCVEISRMAIDPAMQGSDVVFRVFQASALEFIPKTEYVFLLSTDDLAKNYLALGATKLEGPIPHPVAKDQQLSLFVLESARLKAGRMSALTWLFFAREFIDFLSSFGFTRRTRVPVFKYVRAPFELGAKRARKLIRSRKRKSQSN